MRYTLKLILCALLCSVLVAGLGLPVYAANAAPAGVKKASAGPAGDIQDEPVAKAKVLSKQEKREQSLKKISEEAYEYWKKFEKAADSESSRRAINIQLRIETHQKINAKGFPTGNGGAGWSGEKHGKYHHAFETTGSRYFGALCMSFVHFDMVSTKKIQKLAENDKELAWMAYAAEAQQYLESRHRTWQNAVANGGGW
jgi:hypothetical protein